MNANGMPIEERCNCRNYLIDQQIRKLEEIFVREGGFSERMTRARLAARGPWKKGVAMTLLIAESQPVEKDIICKVIVNWINQDNL